MKHPVAFALVVGFTSFVGCSDSDPEASATGGSGGASGSSGSGGSGGSTGGTGGATGGTGGTGGATGGSGGATGGTGGTAGSDAGNDGGNLDASPDGATGGDSGVDAGSCTLGEACCSGSTCNGSYSCLGQTCGCIIALHGDLYLRSDGQVFDNAGTPKVVEVGATGVPLSDITEIFDGNLHGCALKNDGTVWCWAHNTASNTSGQLGQGTIGGATVPQQALQVLVAPGIDGGAATPLTKVAHLNSGSSRSYLASTTCAILTDKTLWCWGSDQNGGGGSSFYTDTVVKARPYATQMMAAVATPLKGVDQVGIGRRHMCALRTGDVFCWGVNVYGALGIGTNVSKVYPTKITLPGPAQQIGVGSDASCARVSDKVYCWGVNNSGQLGVGTPVVEPNCSTSCQKAPGGPVLKAPATPLTGVVDLNVAYSSACARLADHSLHCWGNGAGNMAAPLMLSAAPVVNVALHTTHGSGAITSAIRHLTRDNVLKRGQNTVTPVCQ